MFKNKDIFRNKAIIRQLKEIDAGIFKITLKYYFTSAYISPKRCLFIEYQTNTYFGIDQREY